MGKRGGVGCTSRIPEGGGGTCRGSLEGGSPTGTLGGRGTLDPDIFGRISGGGCILFKKGGTGGIPGGGTDGGGGRVPVATVTSNRISGGETPHLLVRGGNVPAALLAVSPR